MMRPCRRPERRLAKAISGVLLAISISALMGCDLPTTGSSSLITTGRSEPPWMLVWSTPPGGIPASLSPQAAFALGAQVLHNGALVPFSDINVNWLATGPTFCLALARLDPAATFQMAALLYSTSQTGWVGNATTVRDGAACQNQDAQRQSNGVTFPQPVCSVGSLGKVPTPSQPWDYNLSSWYAASQTYLAFTSASAQIQRPSDASAISLAGEQGWRFQQDDIAVVALFTAPSHISLFACLNDAQHCRELATQALQ